MKLAPIIAALRARCPEFQNRVADVFWPDFDQQGLHQAISDYNKRHRRFGGV